MTLRTIPTKPLSLILAVALATGAAPASLEAATVVAAANNLQSVLPELAAAFEESGESELRLVFGASGNLTRQIREGAPFELFLSADQDYVAVLAAEGLTDILIDTGEFVALGQRPDGGAWPVRLAQGGAADLSNRALATSAPTGTVFDQNGRYGHILDPRTGEPAPARWAGISITAPSAALADALSTGACLLADRGEIDTVAAKFGATCVSAVPA